VNTEPLTDGADLSQWRRQFSLSQTDFLAEIERDGAAVVEPPITRDLGSGDSAKGVARLRLAIADMRRREPVMGPTECPASVRIAVRGDEPALEDLLGMDAAENAVSVAPFSPADVQDMIRVATREAGLGSIGVIDDAAGRPIAAVGLFPAKWWWSSAWYLMEQFTFVAPDHRRSHHARDLVLFARWASDHLSAQLGYRVYLLHGITATSDADRKVRLLNRMSNYVGSLFLYPMPEGARK
jgi:hypothetical protein